MHRHSVAGVVHCFTGTAQEAQQALDLGLYIGITGWICDERPERGAAALAELVLPMIPNDRLVLETDAPYLTPRTYGGTSLKKRPSRNEPALLQVVLRAVAKARGQSMEEVAEMTTENAKRLFGI
jgi:TatD DNase family protein